MAVHTKTVEYVFPSYPTPVAPGVQFDFSATTLYIPETVSRVFRAARIQLFCRDNSVTPINGTTPTVRVKLGEESWDAQALGLVPNSGENWSTWLERDVTSYFNTSFGSGISQTCQVGFVVSGPTVTNITAKLILTYDYEDCTTRLKTVRIPLESNAGFLSDVLQEIGENQIPALDSFLPEVSKVYRSIWIELWYNEYTTGAVNHARLALAIDNGAEYQTDEHYSGNASSCFGFHIWDQGAVPVWDTDLSHAIKIRSTNIVTASRFNHVGIVLCVTYEYDHDSSDTILNSLVLPLDCIVNAPGGVAGNECEIPAEFFIEEPGPISLKQSGALICYSPTAAVMTWSKFGAIPGKTIADESNPLFCGQSAFVQRIDTFADGDNLVAGGDCEGDIGPTLRWEQVGAQANVTSLRSTEESYDGVSSRKITLVTGGGGDLGFCDSFSSVDLHDLVPGQTYTLKLRLKIRAADGPPASYMSFFITDWVGGNEAATMVVAQEIYDAWQEITVTRTVRSSADGLYFRMHFSSATSVGKFVFLDVVRIDGPQPAAAFEIARGRNKFYWSLQTNAINSYTFWSTLLLNYLSGKHPLGDGVHNHSTLWSINPSVSPYTALHVGPSQWFNIVESEWFLNNLAFISAGSNLGLNPQIAGMSIESLAGEWGGIDFEEIGNAWAWCEGENAVFMWIFTGKQVQDKFRRWANDSDTKRFDIEGDRRIRIIGYGHLAMFSWMTIHSITKVIEGTIYRSGGGTITIHAFRDVDGQREEIGRAVRTGDGSYSITVYDDTENIFTEAEENGGLGVGRSDSGVAV